MTKIKVLAIPGSVRAGSSNHKVIKIVESMMPHEVEFIHYERLASLAHFDGSENPPTPVKEFLQQVREADGIFICTPEYAFGVPGTLKNALDWTVGNGEFAYKPVAYITASTGGEKAHESLGYTLAAMSSEVPEGGSLLISFIRAKLTPEGQIRDEDVRNSIQQVVNALVQAIELKKKASV